MEKLKTIIKSIWAKIPKTKTEFIDLFDKCLSFLKHFLHKIWAFLKSAYAWVSNFYQKHSKLIHKCLHADLILFLAGLSCLWFYGFVILSLDFLDLYRDPTQESWSSQLRMAAFILVAWFGAPFLVWRTWIASKQANTAQEKAYTELFTQAVEQLGSVKPVGKDQYEENIEVRVGALYALERIMHDSDKDAKTIIDTLCTYVKHNCGKPKIFEDEISKTELEKLSKDEIRTKRDEFIETLKEDPPANRYDIQTALKIIGRRPPKYKTEQTMPDLSNVNLQGADLVNFDLSHCKLNNAHLEGADLFRANLQRADLFRANLQRAKLQGANLHGANLHGAYLHGANLQRAKLQGANLHGANLHGADLFRANLQRAKLQGANLHGANLQRADLFRANLQRAKLQGANLHGANLHGADLHGANLQRANLHGANLHGADLHGANLQRANLQRANLHGADLHGANLQRAGLYGANLQRANLVNVQITDAHKTAASVIWVDFTKVKYDFDILQEQVKNMFGHKTLTILPEGMKVPDHWSEANMETDEGEEQYYSEWEAFKKEKGLSEL